MARIETDTNPWVSVHEGDDLGEFLEARPDCRALSRGVLEQHQRLSRRPFIEQTAQVACDEADGFGRTAGRVTTRMQHDTEKTQRFGAIDLVSHRGARLRAQRVSGACKVDQIAGVRHDSLETGGRHAGAGLRNFLRRDRTPSPLAGVLREYLERIAPVNDGAL